MPRSGRPGLVRVEEVSPHRDDAGGVLANGLHVGERRPVRHRRTARADGRPSPPRPRRGPARQTRGPSSMNACGPLDESVEAVVEQGLVADMPRGDGPSIPAVAHVSLLVPRRAKGTEPGSSAPRIPAAGQRPETLGTRRRRYTPVVLKLVIPKGSLEQQTLRLFEAADLAGASILEPRLSRLRRRRSHRARERAAPAGDPHLRRRRPVRPRHHGTGLDRRDRQRRRGAREPQLREDGHRPRHDDRARGSHRPPRGQREGDAPRVEDLDRVRADHRAILRRPRHPRQGGVELRRHRGEGPRDRRCHRRRHGNRQHAARARHEDHRDAPHERTGARREQGARQPTAPREPRWTTSRPCCSGRSPRKAAC